MKTASGRADSINSRVTWNGANFFTLGGFALLPHAGPDIGVHRVRIRHRDARIVRQRDLAAGRFGQRARFAQDARIGLVAYRRCERKVHAESRRVQHQRVRHIISIADKGQLHTAQFWPVRMPKVLA